MLDRWIRRRRWRLVETRLGDGLTCLRAVARDTGQVRDFLEPADSAVPDRPGRPPIAGRRQALARLAGHLARSTVAFCPNSVCAAHATILPFQLEPALAVLAGTRRVLIADGVGMGKTIQAGLIAAALLDARPDGRALIVTPATLLRQWAAELRDKFQIDPHVADASTLAQRRADAPYLASPWLLPGVWLTSADFLKQPHVIDGLPHEPWDLLVVDEAHHLGGDSLRHDAIDALGRHAIHVVLLTATPHDGDTQRYQRVLAVGAQGDRVTVFRRLNRPGPARRVRWLPVRLSETDLRMLHTIDAFERARHRAAVLDSDDATAGLALICGVFRRRALSSPLALHASLERRLAIVEERPADDWRQPALFDTDDFPEHEALALGGNSGLSAETERRWLFRLRHLCAGRSAGGRARALRLLLRRSAEPVIVFSQYRDSLPAIAEALPPQRTPAIIHGGLSPDAQHRALQAFITGRADTLIATDVASQGLNLHTAARWAISFDVPWTPLRLEQRIGRVDRLGQTRRVHATVLTSRHPYDVLQRSRINNRDQITGSAPIESCRRWTAAAVGLADLYGRLRALSARWRTGLAPDPVDASVSAAFVRRWLGRHAAGVACLEVPIVSRTGAVLERHVVAVELGTPEDAVAAHFQRRAAVLARRVQRRAAQRMAVRTRETTLVQPGLFERNPPASDPPAAEATDRSGAAGVGVGAPRTLVRFLVTPAPR